MQSIASLREIDDLQARCRIFVTSRDIVNRPRDLDHVTDIHHSSVKMTITEAISRMFHLADSHLDLKEVSLPR